MIQLVKTASATNNVQSSKEPATNKATGDDETWSPENGQESTSPADPGRGFGIIGRPE
jgi:hypothetical protein